MTTRRAGILLHPTSLPGRFGVGDLGPAARRFADFLAAAGQSLWQVLPLVPTGYGDSPYQGLGAFAGNPLLVSPEDLVADGLLDEADLAAAPVFPEGAVDYGPVIAWKTALLRRAADRFEARASPALRQAFDEFRHGAPWLDDFALFVALKDRHAGLPWTRWPAPFADREPRALARALRELAPDLHAAAFAQFAFDRQWHALRAHARARGVGLVGDLPIYVAHDCAEVWSRRELFQLDLRGEPAFVAGVPPDYFSATGQLWGNPLYRWEERAQECHAFVLERLRAALGQVDLVRVDHFRGFEAYWAVPAGAPTSREGAWRPGPGAALFDRLERELGDLPLIAENLGVITPEVEALRHRYRLPGMAILSFAFGKDPQAPGFRPHAYARDLVAYTGTHDNDTVVGWWASEGGDSIRAPEDVRQEKDFARRYLDLGERPIHEVMIRALLASVADTAIVPLQDVLGLGSAARMNRPATATGNWRWRFREGALTPATAGWLGELAGLYGRT